MHSLNMPMDHRQPHDVFFRKVFSDQEIALEYFDLFLPDDIRNLLDLDTLQSKEGSFIDQTLKEHFSDVIYECQTKTHEVITITLLLEHKSVQEPYPHLQLLRYLVNVWERQKASGRKTLCPVLPIIIYHGKKPWDSQPFESSFAGLTRPYLPYFPEFTYLLTDLSQYAEEELLAMEGSWLRHAFLALKVSREANVLSKLSTVFFNFDIYGKKDKAETFIQWVFVYLFRGNIPERNQVMEEFSKLKEPVKSEALTIYDAIFMDGSDAGEMKASFTVFKNGLNMGLNLEQLTTLTEIDQATASQWHKLLSQNPDADFPGV